MPIMSLKQDEANLLELEVLRRTHSMPASSWDGNWLRMRVRASVDSRVTEFVADLQVEDLEQFLEELRAGPPEGEEVVALQTLEGDVAVFLKELSAGLYEAECTASESGENFGPRISFALVVTNDVVEELIRQLDLTLALYPSSGQYGRRANGWPRNRDGCN